VGARAPRHRASAAEAVSEAVQEALRHLLAEPERPRLQGRPFHWKGVFSDGQRQDAILVDPRDEAVITVDFRFVTGDERSESAWIKRSGEHELQNRLVWVAVATAHRCSRSRASSASRGR
jgi:hypothetical protein